MSEVVNTILAHQESVPADNNGVGGDYKVYAYIRKGGIIFGCNGVEDGPYYYFEDIDAKSIAVKFGVNPKDVEIAKLEAIRGLLESPRLFDEIVCEISRTVAGDDTVKRIVFLTYLSAYITDRQSRSLPLNLFIKGESSTGKTYNAVEVSRLFPKEDVLKLGGLSPKALVHRYGEFDTDKNENIVDLSGKILLFLEAPDRETLDMLKPILSHDDYEIRYEFTDKTGKGKLKTYRTVIKGWPATIFCTTNTKYLEELSNRSLTVTPEYSSEKFRNAIMKIAEIELNFDTSEKTPVMKRVISKLLERIKELKPEVWIPFIDEMAKDFPADQGRDMRDFKKLVALTKLFAVLHVHNRPILVTAEGRNIIIALPEDYEKAYEIFSNVAETTRSGLSGHVLDFYYRVFRAVVGEKKAVSEAYDEVRVYVSDLVDKYREVYGVAKSSDYIRMYLLYPLKDAGFIDSRPDPDDKRKKYYIDLYDLKKPIFAEKTDNRDFSIDLIKQRLVRLQKKIPIKKLVYKGLEVDLSQMCSDVQLCTLEEENLPGIITEILSVFFQPESSLNSREAKFCDKTDEIPIIYNSTKSIGGKQ